MCNDHWVDRYWAFYGEECYMSRNEFRKFSSRYFAGCAQCEVTGLHVGGDARRAFAMKRRLQLSCPTRQLNQCKKRRKKRKKAKKLGVKDERIQAKD